MPNQDNKNRKANVFLICLAIIAFLFTMTILVYFKMKINLVSADMESDTIKYDKVYALIPMTEDDEFWAPVYSEIKSYGDSKGVYVQWMGKDITSEFSWSELMEIAMDADVDGIILEGDESDECKYLINKATAKGIPVVTVRNDSPASRRISYVGVSNYNLGIEYGYLIVSSALDMLKNDENKENVRVSVLIDKNTTGTSQNTILLAIQEQLVKAELNDDEISIETVLVDNETDFSAEESIQDVFKSSTVPDIVICLNEVNTMSVYQAVVDQNKVGQVAIIGYSDSESVMKAIQKDVIRATITADVEQLGQSCVDAIDEYSQFGRVSAYYAVNFTMIDSKNIAGYLIDEETDESE